jgi:DNA/RNA-binding domain of Phe-tRNA-synthetase-like protein
MNKQEWQAQADKLSDSAFIAAYAECFINFCNEVKKENPNITNEELLKKVEKASFAA